MRQELFSLLPALIFSFCFFSVLCFKDAAFAVPTQGSAKPLLIGLLFVLIAFLLGFVK